MHSIIAWQLVSAEMTIWRRPLHIWAPSCSIFSDTMPMSYLTGWRRTLRVKHALVKQHLTPAAAVSHQLDGACVVARYGLEWVRGRDQQKPAARGAG